METTGLEPANADDNASIDTPEVDSEGAEIEGAEPAPAAADTGKPPRDRVQERIDTLTREKYEALSARDRERYQREAVEARLAEREAAEAKPPTVAPSDEYPTLESVGWDEEKLRVAIDAYYDKKLDARAESTLAKREEAAKRAQAATAWDRKQSEFIKANPEYADKVVAAGRRGEWACTDVMTEVIQQSDIGPEVAQYLAENAAKSFEIARLPANLQARELGRIEARLEAAKAAPPPVSKAPPPPGKIDGAASTTAVSTTDPDSDKLSDDDWFKAEKRRLSRKKG